ncbi:hypothetical protein DF3PB_30031 [uncultured Defluviicoccus sp.]|uniref:Uncharacterized protein n=1 Tax=metagenome TaxID=256318 RepID=A0A380TEL4_9ZZZZ|nr:hypothetical protein DF3PB_30031 [uncultured Defluviicoccus sp.]
MKPSHPRLQLGKVCLVLIVGLVAGHMVCIRPSAPRHPANAGEILAVAKPGQIWRGKTRIGTPPDDYVEAALAEACQLESSAERQQAICRLIITLAEENPKLAALLFRLLSDGATQPPTVEVIASGMAKGDPADMVAWLKTLPGGLLRQIALDVIIREIDRLDNTTAEQVVALAPDRSRNSIISRLAVRWAAIDIAAAVAWAGRLSDATESAVAYSGLARRWAETAPTAGLAYCRQLAPGEGREEFVYNFGLGLADHDPATAMELAAQLPAGDVRNRYITQVLAGMARSLPENAAELAAALADLCPFDAALTAITDVWVQNNPHDAAVWVARLSDGDTRSSLLREITERWSRVDALAAGDWLATLAADEIREQAVHAYIDQVAPRYPRLAAPWALTFADEGMRSKELGNLIRNWRQADPSAAMAWINGAALPESAKHLLLAGP